MIGLESMDLKAFDDITFKTDNIEWLNTYYMRWCRTHWDHTGDNFDLQIAAFNRFRFTHWDLYRELISGSEGLEELGSETGDRGTRMEFGAGWRRD